MGVAFALDFSEIMKCASGPFLDVGLYVRFVKVENVVACLILHETDNHRIDTHRAWLQSLAGSLLDCV